MEKNIDFFRKGIIIFSCVLLNSCIADKKAMTEQYYNFIYNNSRNGDIQLETSKFENASYPLNLLSFCVKSTYGKDTIISSYFEIQHRKSLVPKKFKNKHDKFIYSLMPHYTEVNLVGKSYIFNNNHFVLIRGENPFCNGNNCQTYYLHLLEITDRFISRNEVYEFNQREIDFNNLILKIDGKNLILCDRIKTLDIIKW